MSLIPLNPQTLAQHAKGTQEIAVSDYLQRAKEWLHTAVEQTGPEQIAMAKAEIATAAEATKQLNLSKDIQLDAQEMVRRAEYALAKAIRKGQTEGTIATQGTRNDRLLANSERLPRVTDIEPGFYQNGSQIVQMSNDVDPADFDAAIDEAKAEGNLSRANVVRKIKGKASGETREQRAGRIGQLAADGYTSRQIAEKVGIGFDAVRNICRDFDIDVPADVVMARTKRINSDARVIGNTVTALEALATGLDRLNPEGIDPAEAADWVASLTTSISALTRLKKQIAKEATQ